MTAETVNFDQIVNIFLKRFWNQSGTIIFQMFLVFFEIKGTKAAPRQVTKIDRTNMRFWNASNFEPEVLQNVVAHISGASKLRVPLEKTRAQVLCVSGSFESSEVTALPSSGIIEKTRGEFIFDGMTGLVAQAYRENALFSELGVSWGSKGRKIDLRNYKYFPTYRR